MKTIIFSLFLLIWPTASFANDTDTIEIQETISQQISSFQVDDFEKAFTFASPSIKSMFGNSENFGKMVRRGFPMVWRTKEVTYLELSILNGDPVQRVMITDINAEIFILNYIMTKTENGWKIRGVTIDERPST